MNDRGAAKSRRISRNHRRGIISRSDWSGARTHSQKNPNTTAAYAVVPVALNAEQVGEHERHGKAEREPTEGSFSTSPRRGEGASLTSH